MERPYTYQMDGISSTWQDYFRAFLRNREYDLDTTASTLMKKLREDYNIPSDWTQDVPWRYGKRHRGLEHSTLYPALPELRTRSNDGTASHTVPPLGHFPDRTAKAGIK